MFNLGIKNMVINANSTVVETPTAGGDAGIIDIKGFGKFVIPTVAEAGTREGFIKASAAAAKGVYTAVIPNFSSTKKYDITLNIRTERARGEEFTDGLVKTFQTGEGASIGAAAAAGQIAGFNDTHVKFSGTGDNLIITFQDGSEGDVLETLSVVESATGVSLPVSSIAITTAPSYGIGLGKIVEEEVQNATYANVDPYGLNGVEAVDIRGTYTEIYFKVPAGKVNEGWLPHNSLGRDNVNTDAVDGPIEFCLFVNEASAADTITAVSKLVTGEAIAV